jgi:hypothetical protein
MTNAHSETGQMTVCFQNLTLGALSNRSALSVLVGALFEKFGLFLNTPRVCTCIYRVLYSLYCVFVLFRLCIFILICFVCTGVRTTGTE